MPTEILMPALSPTMQEGTLAKWLVAEGARVAAGDVIAEIETDKATMEFEAVDEGTIGKILIAEGTEGVKVNTPIAVLLDDGESLDAIGTQAPATPPSARDGAPKAGTAAAGEKAASRAAGDGGSAEPAPPAPHGADGNRIFASPLARRIAALEGLDLAKIHGSGPHGRILRADVDAAIASPARASAPASVTAAPARAAPPAGPSSDAVAQMYAGRTYAEVKLDGMRRTVAARLTEAKQTIPHYYLRRSVVLDPLLNLRAQMNAAFEPRGIKLSVNDFVIKACALALQDVPEANAVWAGDRILRLAASDVAVAVAVEGGLFTPVLKDAEAKSFSALSSEMKDLASRAQTRALSPQEYVGGAMTISNLGMYGVENFDAVINPPHASILAVGASLRKPVVGEGDTVTIATVMSVTLSVDHRIMDGALGAIFLKSIIGYLENPYRMLA